MAIDKLPKYCGKCALRNDQQKICQLTNLPYESGDLACKHFCKTIPQCGTCQRRFPSLKTIMDNDYVCDDCLNRLGTCAVCEYQNTCDFETNPSTLPKIVQKVIRQGNAQMMTQVRNPEREKITCAAGCKCYDKTYGCSRQDGLCVNYEYRQKS